MDLFFLLKTGLSNGTGRNSFRSGTGLGPALDGVQTTEIVESFSSLFRSGLGCFGGGGGSLPGDQTPVK